MDKQVKISSSYHQTLVTLAAKKDRSLKDYLEQCILFFKTTELDPKEIDAEGIRSEIKKLDRRVVSFFKTQEKEKIEPILDELSIISKSITESLSISPTKKDYSMLAGFTKESIQKLTESHNNLAKILGEAKAREILDLKHRARKAFNDYLVELEGKGALTSPKAINDNYKRVFETL